ncbi:MAG: type II secretion system protein [Lysobacter sp.]|nr:type II secretion system protein [Lysobacter sp.]
MTRFSAAARRQRGYTLIEVVVAFGLLAFGMTLLLGTLTNATRQVRAADEYGRAALHAQSLLAQIGVGQALAAGRRNGRLDEGRYRWDVVVSPWRDPQAAGQGAQPQPQALVGPKLMRVEVSVAWGEGGPRERLYLETLRLVAPTDPNAAGVVP